MAVDLNDGCVDYRVFHVWLVSQGIEYPFEYIGLDPAAEPPEGAVPIAELRRKIAPRRIRAHDPKHCFKKQPRIGTSTPRYGQTAEAQWLNCTPLAIRENKSAGVHTNLLFWKLESELKPNGNPECPQTLV